MTWPCPDLGLLPCPVCPSSCHHGQYLPTPHLASASPLQGGTSCRDHGGVTVERPRKRGVLCRHPTGPRREALCPPGQEGQLCPHHSTRLGTWPRVSVWKGLIPSGALSPAELSFEAMKMSVLSTQCFCAQGLCTHMVSLVAWPPPS